MIRQWLVVVVLQWMVRWDVQAFLSPRVSTSRVVLVVYNSFVDIHEHAMRDVTSYESWAIHYGAQKADSITICDTTPPNDPYMQVGLMTTNHVSPGTPLLYIPSSIVLSAIQARSEMGQLDKAEERLKLLGASDHVNCFYLFLKLLLEYQQGTQSPYFAVLNAMPRYFANGASMTPFCFDCLPPLAASLARDERVTFIQFYQALKLVPSEWLHPSIVENKPLAKWAFAICRTRGSAVPTTIVDKYINPDGKDDWKIPPLIDCCNHAAVPNVELSYDGDGNACLTSIVEIPAGSQLFVNYGDATNPSQLFARYGFLDESASATFCKYMIAKPTPQQVAMGYDPTLMLFSTQGQISEQVYDVFLYQLLGNSSPQTQQQFFQAHVNGDVATKQAIHNEYYTLTINAILSHVNNFLQELDRLSAKGDGVDWSEHPRLPLILQHNAFVKQTFLAVQANLLQQTR